MPSAPPRNKWAPFPCTGVLDESLAPSRVGGSGLLDCTNLIYERDGAWGKRSGSSVGYQIPTVKGAFPSNPYVSGVRWYRAYPTPATFTVFAAGGSLWQADDLGSTPKKLLDFNSAPKQPIRFCSARDPNAKNGDGSDVLIIVGATSDLSFATNFILVTTSGPNGPGSVGHNPAPTATITITFKRDAGSTSTPGGSDPFQITYSPLPTDNAVTIAQNLCDLINEAYAVATNGPGPDAGANCPFLCQAYTSSPSKAFGHPTGSVIHLGALVAGTAGNDITYTLTYTAGANGMGGGGEITFTDQDGTHGPYDSSDETYTSSGWTGGGQPTRSPLKWDGDNAVDGLSFQVDQPFHNCVTWHDHVWLWGDPGNPDTLYACDIDQPEGFTFMNQEGGYDIGAGDGDPMVQNCVPIGNTLYVFKTQSIYAVTGYDFQSGEYAFSVTPQVAGYGIPAPDCVAVLENALVFWSGRRFLRLAVGAYQPEFIGMTIPISEGTVAQGDPTLMRVVAGDFPALSALNNDYVGGTGPVSVMRTSIAIFAYANGKALVYDEEATQRKGRYAWAKWTGWNVGWWLPFGTGQDSSGAGYDSSQLLFLSPPFQQAAVASLFGGSATLDSGAAIPWMARAGWASIGTPEIRKYGSRIFIESNATGGAKFVGAVSVAQSNIPNVQLSGPIPPVTFVPTVAPSGGEAYNVLQQQIMRSIQSVGYEFTFTEDGSSAAGFELTSYGLDLIEEAFT